MNEIKFKKNKFQSTICKIKFYIFKIKVRSLGISIWDKNLKDLISELQYNVTIQNDIIDGKTTAIEVLVVVFNHNMHLNKSNIRQQIFIGNQALIKSSRRFSIPLKDKKIGLIFWWIKQELLQNQ